MHRLTTWLDVSENNPLEGRLGTIVTLGGDVRVALSEVESGGTVAKVTVTGSQSAIMCWLVLSFEGNHNEAATELEAAGRDGRLVKIR